MYSIFTYIWAICWVNVGKYSIHWDTLSIWDYLTMGKKTDWFFSRFWIWRTKQPKFLLQILNRQNQLSMLDFFLSDPGFAGFNCQIKVQDKTLTFKMLGVRRFLVPLLKIRVYLIFEWIHYNSLIHPHIHGIHVGQSWNKILDLYWHRYPELVIHIQNIQIIRNQKEKNPSFHEDPWSHNYAIWSH